MLVAHLDKYQRGQSRGMANNEHNSGTPESDTLIESCGIPVDQYFWLNSLHPTGPIHEVVADQVAKLLEAGPNVC